MRHLAVIAAALIFLPCAVRGEVSLMPTEPARTVGLYAQAELLIPQDQINPNTRAIRVRDALGGPAWIVPLLPSADGPTRCPLLLPPLQVYQDYTIDLLDAASPEANVLSTLNASLVWPATQVNRDAFIDPTFCTDFEARQVSWPAPIKWTVLLGAAVAGLTCLGVRLWLGARYRVLTLIVLLVLAGSATWVYLRSQPAIVERQGAEHDVIILAARRTDTWHSTCIHTPVYRDLGAWMEDETVITPGAIDVPITPGQIKLLLPAGKTAPD